jgi:hypothetical protein
VNRCVGCRQYAVDAAASAHDGATRCPACERHFDHRRRLAAGDKWYRSCVEEFAERGHGPEWRRRPWQMVCDLFADTRALGGWTAVGVDASPRPRERGILTRPCSDCGEPTTSITNYFCASCHFSGWYGRWRRKPTTPKGRR